MSASIHRLNRQELYDLVWSEAVTKVSARYGLSDVGLRKICVKHRIPLPPRGYWRQIETGRKLRKTPLPKVREETEIVVRVMAQPEIIQPPEVVEQAEREEGAFPPIVVGQHLERPHAVARTLQRELGRQKPDDYGAVHSTTADAFLVRVHPTSVDRVLRISDALAKAAEARRFELRAGKEGAKYGGQLSVVVDGFAFDISLNERMRQEPYRATPEEIARRKRGHFVYTPTYQYRPTGELTLTLSPAWGSGLQSTWKDSKARKIEDRLGEVVLGLRKLAHWRAADRKREQARQARHEADQQRRAALRAQVAAERERVSRLEADAAAWQRAEAIRAFAAARQASGHPDTDIDLEAWLAWAHDQADRIDPLRPSPASVLDTPESEMQPVPIWNFPNE